MRTTEPSVHRQPIWVAALLASTGSDTTNSMIRHELGCESGRTSLRIMNAGPSPVFISALGVQLAAASMLDVRWPAGATAYEFQVKRCPMAA